MQLKLLSLANFSCQHNKQVGVNTMRMRITKDFLMSQLEKRLDDGWWVQWGGREQKAGGRDEWTESPQDDKVFWSMPRPQGAVKPNEGEGMEGGRKRGRQVETEAERAESYVRLIGAINTLIKVKLLINKWNVLKTQWQQQQQQHKQLQQQ